MKSRGFIFEQKIVFTQSMCFLCKKIMHVQFRNQNTEISKVFLHKNNWLFFNKTLKKMFFFL